MQSYIQKTWEQFPYSFLALGALFKQLLSVFNTHRTSPRPDTQSQIIGNVVVDPIWIQMSPSCSPENVSRPIIWSRLETRTLSMIWIGERALLRRIHIKHMLNQLLVHHPISIDMTSINCPGLELQGIQGIQAKQTLHCPGQDGTTLEM